MGDVGSDAQRSGSLWSVHADMPSTARRPVYMKMPLELEEDTGTTIDLKGWILCDGRLWIDLTSIAQALGVERTPQKLCNWWNFGKAS